MLLATIGTLLIVLVVLTSIRARRPPAALRVVAPDPPLRLRRDGPGAAAPAGRGRLRAALGAGVVPAPLRRGAGRRCCGGACWCRCGSRRGTGSRSARSSERGRHPGAGVGDACPGATWTRLGARAGDFLTWRFLTGRGALGGHPYSLSAAPTADSCGSPSGPARRTASGSPGCDPAPGCWSRARTARWPTAPSAPAPAAGGGRARDHAAAGAARGGAPGRGDPAAPGRPAPPAASARAGAHPRWPAARDVALVRLAGPRRSAYSWLPEGYEGPEADVLRGLVPRLADSDVVLCGPPDWSDRVAAIAATRPAYAVATCTARTSAGSADRGAPTLSGSRSAGCVSSGPSPGAGVAGPCGVRPTWHRAGSSVSGPAPGSARRRIRARALPGRGRGAAPARRGSSGSGRAAAGRPVPRP